MTVNDLRNRTSGKSRLQSDGPHTPAKRGGIAVDHQDRKKVKSTNMLLITDRQGIPLTCSAPIAGNHNDLCDIEKMVLKMGGTCLKTKKAIDGLFLNAGTRFDSKPLRLLCESLGIIPNFDINKRNTKKPDKHKNQFDNQL